MQFLFFFLLMIGIWIGVGCHMSNRPPRKVIQVIEFIPLTQPREAPEIDPSDITDLPDPNAPPLSSTPNRPLWPF